MTRCRRSISSSLSVLAFSLPLALGVGACGTVAHPHVADNEGFYVDAGPITYQVQLTRELSPYAVEDMEYLKGVSAPAPKPDEQWFAVFLWANNQTSTSQTTSGSFDIVDTQGNKYLPVAIDAKVNPFAWTAQTLPPSGTEPAPNSAASVGPTQGGEVLFKINDAAYANRPLTLEIHAAGQTNASTIQLDL